LTSFDNRIDRVEELSILTTEKNLSFAKERLELEISERKRKIENERREFFNNAFWTGVLLVFSLLFSVVGFAHNQISWAFVYLLSELSILFLFFGIGYTFWMFRKLGRRRETTMI
jgi:cation transport ATPase